MRILLAAPVLLSFALRASAWPTRDYEQATVVEAATYIQCSDACTLLDSPASAFCFRSGDQVLAAEEKGYLRGGKTAGLEDLAGEQVSISVGRWFIWMKLPDGHTVRLRRGSLYEGFKDSGCVAEVHRPILEHANSLRRPAKVPDDAFAVAGSGRGDFQPLFLWYECAMDSDAETIACRRWYVNGDPDGTDWYCARTADGAPVTASFTIDPLLSQAGRLVLRTGAVLQHDNRGRTNDKLDRPHEACR